MNRNYTEEEINMLEENNFQNRFKKAQRKSGLSYEDLEEKTGISVRTFTRYASGKSEPSISILIEICEVLNVSATYLLYGNTQPQGIVEIQNLISDCPEKNLSQLYQIMEIFIKSHTEKGDK